jgi:hypothetical protein
MSDEIKIDIAAVVRGLQDVRNLVREIEKLPTAGAGASGLSKELQTAKAEFKNTVAEVQSLGTATKSAINTSIASISTLPAPVRAVRSEVRAAGTEFSQTARLASSAGRGIENIFRGSVLASLRNFGIAARTAFNESGPLSFAKGVTEAGTASRESQVLVAQFSNTLLAAGKNAEINQQLIQQFGIQAEQALLAPSLASQKFIAGMAQIESAEERAVVVQNLFGASSTEMLPIIESQVSAQQKQEAALSKVLAATERNEIAQAALATETQAATSATTGDLLATQGLANAETEATAATKGLEEAQAELKTVQQGVIGGNVEQSAGFTLSAGTIGIAVVAIGALIYGLSSLFSSEDKLVAVTKEQIQTTERNITLDKEELEIALKLAAAKGDEAAKRQELVEAKRRELAEDTAKQQIEETKVIVDLVTAIQAEHDAYINLQQAQNANIANDGLFTSSVTKASEAVDKATADTKKAAEAANIHAEATGKSTQVIFANALSYLKQSDAIGRTVNAHSDLAHALSLTFDAEGKLVPTIDAVTRAIDDQTAAIRKQTSALDAQAARRDANIDKNIKEISNAPGMTPEKAKAELQKRIKDSSIFADSPYGTLGPDVTTTQRVSKNTEAQEDYLNPRKQRKAKTPRESQLPELLQQLKAVRDEVVNALRDARTTIEDSGIFKNDEGNDVIGAEHQYNLLKDSLDRCKTLLDNELKDRVTSLKGYYEQSENLQQESIQAEIANEQRKEARIVSTLLTTQTKIADELAKKRAQIDKSRAPEAEKDIQKQIATEEAGLKTIKAETTANEQRAAIEERITILKREQQRVTEDTDRAERLALEDFDQQINDFQNEINTLNGKTAEVAISELNKRLQPLLDKAIFEEGKESPLAKLIQAYIDLQTHRAKITEFTDRADKIKGVLDDRVGAVQAHTEDNLIAHANAQREINKLTKEYTDLQLRQLRLALALAQEGHDEKEIANIKLRIAETEKLGKAQDDFRTELKNTAIDAADTGLQNLFSDLVSHVKTAKEAFRDFALSVLDALQKVIIKMIVVKILTKLLGSAFGGGGGDDSSAYSGDGIFSGGSDDNAEGGMISARPGGRIIRVAEGGHDEVVLTTDPKHRNRTLGLLAGFLQRTGIARGFERGGWASEAVASSAASNLALLHSIGSTLNPSRNLTGRVIASLDSRRDGQGSQGATYVTNNWSVKDAQSFTVSKQAVLRDVTRALTRRTY